MLPDVASSYICSAFDIDCIKGCQGSWKYRHCVLTGSLDCNMETCMQSSDAVQATHNVHHLVVNSMDCDPDIQVCVCMPILLTPSSHLS